MSGSVAATIAGYAVPAQAQPKWDHTYVASDCGWAWGCFGRGSGGAAIRSGRGNSFIANCLSKPSGTTGIRYGLDGVCHQAANRILLPALTRVAGARGYYLSISIFGHYGYGDWRRRLVFCTQAPDDLPALTEYDALSVQRQAFEKGPPMSGDTSNGTSLAQMLSFAEEPGTEIEAMDDLCFASGHVFSLAERRKLAEERLAVRSEQRRLSLLCSTEQISREKYLEDFLSIVDRFVSRNLQILGRERFTAVFGNAAGAVEGLIDRSLFLTEQGGHDDDRPTLRAAGG